MIFFAILNMEVQNQRSVTMVTLSLEFKGASAVHAPFSVRPNTMVTISIGSKGASGVHVRVLSSVNRTYRLDSPPIMQGLFVPFACIGSSDPVRVLHLYTTNTLDTL